nr:PREDICTED: uncharacterized protein LOC109039207 [Bemisia tabaci]
MDFGGPIQTRTSTLRNSKVVKTYICVFVCFSTKAVHIETTSDLTTNSFIAALTRFICRRGKPSDLWSDCGSNFLGASNELQKITREFFNAPQNLEIINRFSIANSIKFHNNPPAAPEQGGLWEGAIKSVKTHLKRVVGTHLLTREEFDTLMSKIEAMLNSRPLTPLSQDPSEIDVLTPGHFLIGTTLTALPERPLLDISNNRLKRWETVQAFSQRVRKRWYLEYLTKLQQREKWAKKQPYLKVGDLVLLIEPNAPPLQWPLARVSKVCPGKDNLVRVAEVKTENSTFTRPVSKLCPLPME